VKYKLSIVIFLTVVLLTGGILESVYLCKTLNAFNDKLDKLAQKEIITVEDVIEISDWWDKMHPKLSITISHVQLNEIGITLDELRGAVEAEDYQNASSLLSRINSYAESLIDLYKFNPINIF